MQKPRATGTIRALKSGTLKSTVRIFLPRPKSSASAIQLLRFNGYYILLRQCAEPLEGFLGGITDIFAYDTGKGHFYAQGKDKSLLAKVFEERSFSGIGYLRQKARNLHLIPEAKAQGLGFTALNPLQTLWKGARDISYIFFVLISIFFAFAIMFRMRLFSPQAAVTVQSAIPRIAIALILVT